MSMSITLPKPSHAGRPQRAVEAEQPRLGRGIVEAAVSQRNCVLKAALLPGRAVERVGSRPPSTALALGRRLRQARRHCRVPWQRPFPANRAAAAGCAAPAVEPIDDGQTRLRPRRRQSSDQGFVGQVDQCDRRRSRGRSLPLAMRGHSPRCRRRRARRRRRSGSACPRAAAPALRRRSAACARRTSWPHCWQNTWPILANSSRR